MRGEFTAIVMPGQDGMFVARCAEVPGTETEAETPEEALENLADAISIIFEVNRQEAEEEMPAGAKYHSIVVDYSESRLVSAELV